MSGEILICGGGHQGLSMAAHLALCGEKVALWNRTAANIKDVIRTGKIFCSGIVEGEAIIDKSSSDLEAVFCDFIMVTTPSSAHKDIARLIAPLVTKDTVIVLNPGRTFGAVEFAMTLLECGVKELPHIAETQTIVYTCRRNGQNAATIYALKNDVKIAAIRGSSIEYIMERMPACIRSHFRTVSSIGLTSLSNVGMTLHCAPVLMNVGWIESEIVDFKYYYDGISKTIAKLLEKIDDERIAVSKALGFEIENTAQWLRNAYGVTGDDLYECLRNNVAYREIDAPKSVNTRYIFEDVPNGLVPIEYIGNRLDIKTPVITTIIDLACASLEIDFRKLGRQFDMEVIKNFI